MKHITICLVWCLAAVCSYGQTIQLKARTATAHGYPASLRQKFADFKVLEFPVTEMGSRIHELPADLEIEFDLPEFGALKTELHEINLLAEDYVTIIQTVAGPEQSAVLPDVRSYQGSIAGQSGSSVALTFTDHTIAGFFKTGDGQTYYLEPLRHFDPKAEGNKVVLYDNADILEPEVERYSLAAMSATYQEELAEKTLGPTPTCSPVMVECAIANDYQMVQKFGTISAVIAHTITIMNLVQTNYDFEFAQPVRLKITSIFVSSCLECDPWPLTPNYVELFFSFTDWINAGGFGNASVDWGLLLTPREINGNISGYTMPNGMCGYDRASLVIDYTSILCKLQKHVAHGLGISFGASQTTAPGIMKVGGECSDLWQPNSISQINFALANKTCLSTCSATPPWQPEIFTNIYTPFQVCHTFDNACVAGYNVSTNDPNLSITTAGTTVCLQSLVYNPRTSRVFISARDFCGRESELGLVWHVRIDEGGMQAPENRSNGVQTVPGGLMAWQNNDFLFVADNDKEPETKQVRLFDMNGKLVLEQSATGTTSSISLEALPQGIYIAHIESGKSGIQMKVFHF